MPRVYRVKNDVDNFQYFLTRDSGDYARLNMDGTPRAETWNPPAVYIYKPRLQKGDFFDSSGSALIASPRATETLRLHFEQAGELLPLPYGGEVFTLLNVTECIDCLDQDRTEWRLAPDGTKLAIRKYAFHRDRFSSDIFKIPETCVSEVLVVEDRRDPADEFRYVLTAANLRGLVFEKIWED